VGAYYYPWYAADFHGGQYLRERLIPEQQPVLGEYDDREFEVIGQHLHWSREAGIDFWVASWWGPYFREDQTLRDRVLEHPDLGSFPIAVFYETAGRTLGFTNFAWVDEDVTFLAREYFDHPNYLRIDDRPVLFVYLTRELASLDVLASTIGAMRDAAAEEGFDLYVVGDHVFGGPTQVRTLEHLDAATNYDVYGSMGASRYAGQGSVDAYFRAQEAWRDAAEERGVAFVPAVTPGFNDRAVRDGHEPLSRRLTAEDPHGSLFRAMLQGARPLADEDLDWMLMVTSFNEWHEDTQIEPVDVAEPTTADDSVSGDAFTRGLEYEGYDLRYLDILREQTVP
jgi:hypothetical protein